MKLRPKPKKAEKWADGHLDAHARSLAEAWRRFLRRGGERHPKHRKDLAVWQDDQADD